jgi:cell division protein FtsW
VNMGVVVGLGPITGQPLPLISMGGTAMVFTGLSVGIILSVSRGEQEQNWGKQTAGDEVKVKEKNFDAKAA